MSEIRAVLGSLGEQSSEGPRFYPGEKTGSPAPRRYREKRKIENKSYKTKYDAIMEVEKGDITKKQIAEKYGIPASTLSTWLKYSDSIKEKVASGFIVPQRKRNRTAKYSEVEDSLLKWLTDARAQNVEISSAMMQEKAKDFAEELGVDDFKCSLGYLERFRSRHDIASDWGSNSNDLASDSEAMSDWYNSTENELDSQYNWNSESEVRQNITYTDQDAMSTLRIESVASLNAEEVQVKTEPEDNGYEQAYNNTSTLARALPAAETTDNGTGDAPPSNQNIRSILNNMLDQNKELTVKSVIDDLLTRNNYLLEQVDASIYKPQPRNNYSSKRIEDVASKARKVQPPEQSHILRPGSPTTSCTIPTKDLPSMSQSLMEINAADADGNESGEFVCGVASKAYVMTNEGVNMLSDLQFYWCNFCTFKTESKHILLQHVVEHRFHCKFCSFQAFSRADVIRHANKEHEDFKDTAKTLRFCSFNADYQEAENTKKRKLEETPRRPSPNKKFKSAAQKEKDKQEKKKKEERKKDKDEDYDAFDMEVDEVEGEKDDNEETGDKILIPRRREIMDNANQNSNITQTVVNYNQPSVNRTTAQSKATMGNVTSTSTTKSGSTVTVSSGLCWNCGYCDFVTLSQTFLKTHLNTQHTGKAHKYVAMLVSSQEEMNKIKEKDAQMYANPGPQLSLTSYAGNKVKQTTPTVTAKPADAKDGEATKKDDESSGSGIQSPRDGGSQAEDSEDEEYIPEEEKKKYPLTYKCAHCNFNAPVCFKIKEHLQMKHLGCVLYALDMRAVKLKQRRYVFFCHRKNCSYTTKKTEEYLSHSESCTPWLVENCPEKVDKQTRKCLELTRSFSSKITQKAFQMAKNFKSNKSAEYACIHCSYTTNNNTRLKKHVLSNHRESATVMKDLHAQTMGKRYKVNFCRHCLWETRSEAELQDHLKSKHNDSSFIKFVESENAADTVEEPPTSKTVEKPAPAPTPTTSKAEKVHKPVEKEASRSRSPTPDWESGKSDNTGEEEEADDEIQPEDLEVTEEEVQRMMNEYVKDEATTGRSPGRPMRKASAEASVRVRAQGLQPPMFRCMHCYHMCFGVSLMRKHIGIHHPREPLRAIDVKKMMAKVFAYYCLCPQDRCKFVNTSEQSVINHAVQEHKMKEDDDKLKAMLQPFIPQFSTNAVKPVKAEQEPLDYKEFDNSSSAYECLYCSKRHIENTQLGMKTHVQSEHPSEEVIFRDCLARKLKKSSRIFMCFQNNCDITYNDQKDFELHKLAHDSTRIYECTKCQWFTAAPDSVSSHMSAVHKGEQTTTIEIYLHLDDQGQVVKRVGGTVIKQEPEDN